MRSLILGIGGQDGSYLAEILLNRGHQVFGLHRRTSNDNLQRIERIRDSVKLRQGDVTDVMCMADLIQTIRPDHVYNMADQDNVGWSFHSPQTSLDVTASAVFQLMETVRLLSPETKIFQPISATIFGDAPPPQNEATLLNPRSPYACAKTAALHYCRFFRQHYGLFVTTAIFYNHDSPRRNPDCLLHYLFRCALEIKAGTLDAIPLGDPDLPVDIGYAGEFMVLVADMMDLGRPDDFVVGTGIPRTVKEIAQHVLASMGLSVVLTKPDPEYVSQDGRRILVADISKAKWILGFVPRVRLEELVSRVSMRYKR